MNDSLIPGCPQASLNKVRGENGMPPHCDTRSGPVVTAARRALETGNVNLVLIWPEDAEEEARRAFDRVMKAGTGGQAAREVAEEWFFETVVRLHRAGEGEAFTGLRPEGLDEGPVVPRAEKAIGTGDPKETIRFLCTAVEEDLMHRFHRVMETKNYDVNDVTAGRAYVQAFIGFVVHAHHLYQNITGGGSHGGGHGH